MRTQTWGVVDSPEQALGPNVPLGVEDMDRTGRQHVQGFRGRPAMDDGLDPQEHPAPRALQPVGGEGQGLAGGQELAQTHQAVLDEAQDATPDMRQRLPPRVCVGPT